MTPRSRLSLDYVSDGSTTYCWHIPFPTSETKLNESDRVDYYSGTDGCPLQMTITLSSNTVNTYDNVTVTWTVVANFSEPTGVNMTTLSLGTSTSGKVAQIVHSNVHSCVYGTGCDPFSDGQQLVDKTVNQVANLSDNQATFTDSITFPTAGDYSLLAHIIMPDTNASQRFDFAVFRELVVKDSATATPTPTTATPTPTATVATTSSSSGLSSGATIGIVIAAVVVIAAIAVAVVLYRRKQSPAGDQYLAPPGYDTTVELLANSKNNDDSAQWGVGSNNNNAPGSSASTQNWTASGTIQYPPPNLDQTNSSDGSYAGGSQNSRLTGDSQFRGTASSGGATGISARPRRVDSDLEL